MTRTAADAPVERRPGRPRSVEAERAILKAALEELADRGADGVTVESVAARSGVAKTTIYRRWPSKDELLLDAIRSLDGDHGWSVREDGDVRADLVALLDTIRRRSGGHPFERLLPRMVAAASSRPALMRAYDESVLEPRRRHVREVLQAGVARGQLRADLDVDLAMKAIVFPMLHALSMRTEVTPVPDDFAERMVDLLMEGLAPRDGG